MSKFDLADVCCTRSKKPIFIVIITATTSFLMSEERHRVGRSQNDQNLWILLPKNGNNQVFNP